MTALEAALDGWDRICLLWLDAPTLSARVGMIGELSRLASIAGLPACAKPAAPGAPQPPGPPGSARPAGPAASPDQASATTALADPPSVLVERNERVRADELALDDVDA